MILETVMYLYMYIYILVYIYISIYTYKVPGTSNHLTIVDPKFYVEDFDVFTLPNEKRTLWFRGEELPEAE